jgi:rhodanese-related sulfurtransferase
MSIHGNRVSARGTSAVRRWSGLTLVLVLLLVGGGYAAGQHVGRAATENRRLLERIAVPVAGDVGLVTPEQVLMADADTAQLVDVRSREAYELAHATGAMAMPESEMVDLMATLPTDRTLVLYCSCPDDKTSLRAARTLTGVFHFSNIVVLTGGLDAYTAAGGPVTSTVNDSGVEHQGCGCDTNAPAFKLWAGNLAAEREREREREASD